MKTLIFVVLLSISLAIPAFAGWTVTNLNPIGIPASWAYGVSDNQQVGEAGSHASLWSGTAESRIDLHPALAGTSRSSATAVYGNQQVGWTKVNSAAHASLWSGTADSWVDLNPVGSTWSEALGIFNGQQVGNAFTDGIYSHAGIWSGAADSWVDLSPEEWRESSVTGTSGDQQVGWARNNFQVTHAGLWSGTADSWVDLNPAGIHESKALGVSSGYQVGWTNGPGLNASLWHSASSSWVNLGEFLPTGIYDTSYAEGIYVLNADIWVVGYATKVGGDYEAILWHYTAVPEPTSLFALCGGVVGLLTFRRRR